MTAPMQYRSLGTTGYNVSTVSFGAWAIGGTWGELDDAEAMRCLHRALDLGVNQDIKSRVTYSVITKRLTPDALRDFLLRQLDRAGLGHNTFTPPALDLIVRAADGVLRQARNLCVGCLIEAVRSGNRTIDIDNVNRVLMQPHWQKECDLVDY